MSKRAQKWNFFFLMFVTFNHLMVSKNKFILAFIILFIFVLRTWFGIQINWVEEDYIQIYLIGMEDAFVLDWSFWGPDVFWSKTRIPGAMQGVLAGVPISVYPSMYSPIIFSNLISLIGLLIFAWYIRKRFPAISVFFIVPYLLLLPFPLHHGSVLLNTAYLIFSGSLLVVAVVELFLYRKEMLFAAKYWYAVLGFALLFTFQLHLTWVMFLPFIGVLSIVEIRNEGWKHFSVLVLFFALGSLISGVLILPTLFRFYDAMFAGVEGNLVFKLDRIADFFDLFTRIFSYATYDIDPNFMSFKLSGQQSYFSFVLMRIVKGIGIIQFALFLITSYWLWKDERYRKTALLLSLTMVMALGMYIISNKHLSSRTYILMTMLPVWFSFYSINLLFKFKTVRLIWYITLPLLVLNTFLVGYANYGNEYSFAYPARKAKLETAIKEKNPYVFGKRRKTLMDDLH